MVKGEQLLRIPVATITVQNPQKKSYNRMSDSF